MKDTRLKKLAWQLTSYSVALEAGEHLLINCTPDEFPLVREIIDCAYKLGAHPHVSITDNEIKKSLLLGLTEEQAKVEAIWAKSRMDQMDAVISVNTTRNPMELSCVPIEQLNLYSTLVAQKVNEKTRQGRAKWCVTIYPTPFYANCAGMSTAEFEDYYFEVCCLDYGKLGVAMDQLKKLLEKTDQVYISAPGTDLRFSIKDIKKMSSKGERNIPDGEVYTAPALDSVQGTISFNVPSIFQGTRFENVSLTFKGGKVVASDANHPDRLEAILNIDEGARRVGEFAFGVNPLLNKPMGLTLFDEKIGGSIHIALGNALDLTDNGNRSSIHWDLVSAHWHEYGGGEVYLDDVLIRKDGLFVLPELIPLNQANVTKERSERHD